MHLIVNCQRNLKKKSLFRSLIDQGVFNGWQLAKMKKSIPDMSLA